MVAFQSRAKRLTVHERPHEIHPAGRLTDVQQWHNRRVLHGGGGFHLLAEARLIERRRQVGSKDLDGDWPTCRYIARTVDGPARTAPNLALDDVPIGNRGLEGAELKVGHSNPRQRRPDFTSAAG